MQYRQLGRSGLKVSELCLGTMNFGSRTSPEAAQDILSAAMEAGINFIDTANQYGGDSGCRHDGNDYWPVVSTRSKPTA